MSQINIQYYKNRYSDFILGSYDNKLTGYAGGVPLKINLLELEHNICTR